MFQQPVENHFKSSAH